MEGHITRPLGLDVRYVRVDEDARSEWMRIITKREWSREDVALWTGISAGVVAKLWRPFEVPIQMYDVHVHALCQILGFVSPLTADLQSDQHKSHWLRRERLDRCWSLAILADLLNSQAMRVGSLRLITTDRLRFIEQELDDSAVDQELQRLSQAVFGRFPPLDWTKPVSTQPTFQPVWAK